MDKVGNKSVIYARYSSHNQREESIEDQSTTRFGGFFIANLPKYYCIFALR